MICVDASVVIKWIVDEERSDRARALYRTTVQTGESIVAPTLLPLEITNILRQQMRASGGLSLALATALLDYFISLPVNTGNPAGLHRRALALADAHGLPAAYDAHYLALAEHFNCDLWTDDQRLLRQIGTNLPFVRWIGDYPAP